MRSCMPICVCVRAADALYGSLLYLLESESLTDPGAQWFRQIDDQQVPEPTDSFISLLPSPVMRTRFVLYVPQCWEQDSGPHTCEVASSHRIVLLAFRSWFKEVKVIIRLWIYTLLWFQHPTCLMTSSRCSTYICQLTNCPWELESTHVSKGAIYTDTCIVHQPENLAPCTS